MIEYKTGNILNEQVDAAVNTVNCVGIMGKGIAAQFKRLYPQNFRTYEKACKQGAVQPGLMFTVEVSQLTKPKYVINFPTKRHWKGKSKIEDIELGLLDLSREIDRLHLKSIAIPPLGCGLGGLQWSQVRPLICKMTDKHPDVQFVVFEPNAESHKVPAAKAATPNMTPGRASLIRLMDQYLKSLLDFSITLLEMHKLVYFLQESGLPMRMRFEKNLYGPYATNLGHVLSHIEGHYTIGYEDGGDSPFKELQLIPGALVEAQDFLQHTPDSNAVNHFRKVADLVEGFESPFGLELLSTVHWVVKQENAQSPIEATQAIYNWNDRKKMFSERQIALAFSVLQEKEWIT